MEPNELTLNQVLSTLSVDRIKTLKSYVHISFNRSNTIVYTFT